MAVGQGSHGIYVLLVADVQSAVTDEVATVSGSAAPLSPLSSRYSARIWSCFVLAVMVALIMGVSCYRSIQQLIDREQSVAHTQAVIEELWTLVSASKDVVLLERSYVLTPDSEYETLMRSESADLETRVAMLKQLAGDSQVESSRSEGLERGVKSLNSFVMKVVDTRRAAGLQAATALIQTGYGIHLLQQIEQRVRLMDATEQNLLAQRSRAAQNAGIRTLQIIAFGSLVVIVCMSFSAWYVRYSLSALRISSGELIRSHAQLHELNKELGRSNAELEQFAYSASHDLQEPLRMVASYVQLLRDRYRGRLDSDADDFIDFAVDGAKRMKSLINDLLVYSRAGRSHEPQPVEAGEALEWALSNLSLRVAETHTTVVHGKLPRVMADPTQLGEVFQNLIENAIKFHGSEPPRIEIGISRIDGNWLFSVKDNGIGIAREHQSRVFQMFQRLHRRDEYSGTGIGLAVCRKIVERHGGRIWVEPGKDSGADIRFTLPATA